MTRPMLQVLIASTRPGRIGEPIARWVHGLAVEHGAFEVELVDLAEVALPLFDEPKHPILGQYENEHTKAWSAIVARADAFVFVMPEYNHGVNAALKNALDYLHAEWQHKPVGLVSYGGQSGGARAVAMLKPVLSVLRMVALVEGVLLSFPHGAIADGTFTADDRQTRSGGAMFDQLARMVEVLAPLRTA
jgi:NAD(P)H-dependent FMN reductase